MTTALRSETTQNLERRLATAKRLLLFEKASAHLPDFIHTMMPDENAIDDPNASEYQRTAHGDLLCKLIEEVETGVRKRTAVSIPPQHGKPVAEHELVLMGDGSRKPLRDVQIGDRVITHTGKAQLVSQVFIQGELESLRLRTASGREVIAAPDHPFLTPRGWIQAGHLTTRDVLAVLPGMEFTTAPEMSQTESVLATARLLGYFVGDGCTVQNGPNLQATITCADEIERLDIIHCATVLGFKVTEWQERSKAKCMSLSGGARDFLRQYGLAGKTSHTKRVPEWVFTAGNEAVAHFLGAYFACDGSINRKGGGRKDVCLEFYSVNKLLLQDVQHLMTRIGVQTRVTKKLGSYRGKVHESWRLGATSQSYAYRFAQAVPIFHEKAQRFVEWEATPTEFASPFMGDAIVAIDPVGKFPCRCLTVEVDHSFVAADFVVHNTLHLSLMGPAWILGRNPKARIIVATYNETRAAELGNDFRKLVQSPVFKDIFPTFELAQGSKSSTSMKTTLGGRIFFVGLGGTVTGRTADYFIIDDPMKDDEELQSPLFREKMWKWFFSVAYSRGSKRTRMIALHCLTGDTPVSMANGSRRRLDEIKVGDQVLSWSDGKQVPAKVLNWAPQGVDDILELKTGNHTVRGNARHPFLVLGQQGYYWKKLGEIKKGDLVVASGLEDRQHDARLSTEQAWLLGFMFGDGWLTRRDTVQFHKKSGKWHPRRGIVTCVAMSVYPELNARVVDAFKSQFGVTPKLTKFGYIRTEKQTVGKWFAKHGLDGKAKTKKLPKWIYEESSEVREAFLHGFSEADGNVDRRGTTRVAASNEGMIKGLRQLARSVGLRATNTYYCEQTTQPPNATGPCLNQIWSFGYGTKRNEGEFAVLPVASVKPVGREMVYDIQVEGTESFIADGLVVHNTRWHADDLIGRLCDPSHPDRNRRYKGIADDWMYLNISGVIRDQKLADLLGLKLKSQTEPKVVEAFGLEPISALWEEDKDLAFFAQWKTGDPRTFSALVMGQPTIEDGEYFTKDSLVEYELADLPKNLKIYGASDHAVSEKQNRDESVVGCVGIDEDDNIWILPDIRWEQMPTDKTVEELIFQFKAHAPLLWWMESELISKSFGPFLHKRMTEERVYITIETVTPSKDKQIRARAIQGRMSMGKVRFPRFAPWYARARSQVLQFPYGAHDDFVDWLAHIGMGLMREQRPHQPEPAPKAYVRPAQKIIDETLKRVGTRQREKAAAGW